MKLPKRENDGEASHFSVLFTDLLYLSRGKECIRIQEGRKQRREGGGKEARKEGKQGRNKEKRKVWHLKLRHLVRSFAGIH